MSAFKTILITGCSSGFGMLAAARLASHGHRVFATMRDISKNEFLLMEATKRKGQNNLTILPLDVTDQKSIRAAVDAVVDSAGVIDVLVNNAGYGVGGFFEDLSDKDIRQQFDVNLFGVMNVVREILPVMRPRKKGLILNISSMSAFSGTPAFSAYCSSKWALEGFSECLYMELKPMGIDVALIEPGSYRTRIFEDNAKYAERYNDPLSPYFRKSQHLRDMVYQHIRNNFRDPEEVAVVIEDIVNATSPSFRNIVGIRSYLRYLLLHLIPFKFYAWVVNKFLSVKE